MVDASDAGTGGMTVDLVVDDEAVDQSASDVVIIGPDDGEDGELPKGAELQPDGSVVLTLRFPASLRYQHRGSGVVKEDRFETLHMHRLNGAAMRAVFNAGEGKSVMVGIAQSCRINQAKFDALYDRMDGADATAAARVFEYFLTAGAPPASGPPASP